MIQCKPFLFPGLHIHMLCKRAIDPRLFPSSHPSSDSKIPPALTTYLNQLLQRLTQSIAALDELLMCLIYFLMETAVSAWVLRI